MAIAERSGRVRLRGIAVPKRGTTLHLISTIDPRRVPLLAQDVKRRLDGTSIISSDG